MKYLAIPYSIAAYLFGFASLVALILFVGGVFLPWTIDTGSPVSPRLAGLSAVVANLALVTIWGLQHSVMADPDFKRLWIRIVPPAIERSTYVLIVGLVTFALLALWSPMTLVIWDFSGTLLGAVLFAGYFAGWSITLFSTFLINHFELFGLQQAWQRVRRVTPKEQSFVTPLLYKLVRHPMMSGILIALWCAPALSVGRLLFNIAMTAYILIGLRHEEKTLVDELGDEYRDYQAATPMLVPGMPSATRHHVARNEKA